MKEDMISIAYLVNVLYPGKCPLPHESELLGEPPFRVPLSISPVLFDNVLKPESLLVLYGLPHDNLFQREKSSCQVQGLVKAPTGVQLDFHTRKEDCMRAETLFPKISELLLALLRPFSHSVVHCPGLCPLYPEAVLFLCSCAAVLGPLGGGK